MKDFLFRRVAMPVITLLRQGITPDKIALSLAFGTMLGIFPVLGTTTVLVTVAALLWRLNLAAIHTVHFLMTPIQVLLIIPFVRIGEHLVDAPRQPLSIGAGMDLVSQGGWHAVTTLWGAIAHAMLGWLVIGPPAIVLIYRILRHVLERVARRLRPPAPVPLG